MGRPGALDALRSTIAQFRESATSTSDALAHIEATDKDKGVAECAAAEQWANDKCAAQEKLAKHEDPVLTCADIKKKETELTNFCKPIMSKPKPKPPPAAKKEEPKDTPMDDKKEDEKKDEAAPKEEVPQAMDTEVD